MINNNNNVWFKLKQQQNQQTMVQQHPGAGQHNSYYQTQGYIAQNQNRLPLHVGVGVHAPVQVPTVHQNQQGHVQSTPQHNHTHQQHVTQPSNNSAQMSSRNEAPPPVTAERKRERRILKIVDPTTGN